MSKLSRIIVIIFTIFATFLFLLLQNWPVGGQVSLDISREALPKIPIGLVLPDNFPIFNEVLARDLLWSGYFEPSPLEKESLRSWTGIYATIRKVSGGVETKIFSSGKEMVSFEKGPLATHGERYLAHQVAGEIIERLTGKSAITLSKIVASFQTGKKREIVLLDYDGGQLTFATKDGTLNRCPRLSPDRRFIAYTSYLNYWPEVYLQEIGTGKRRVVASHPGLNSAPAFSPDGKYLALSLSRDGNPEIYLLNLQTEELVRLTSNSAIDTSPFFFPDGKSLAFVSDRSGGPQIYRLDLATGMVKRLTYEGSYNTSPSVSSDGRFLAYTSRMGGQFEIRIMVLESGETVTVTGGEGNKEDPVFGPDSRHILFTYSRNYKSNLKILDIFTGEEFNITEGGGFATPDWR